MTESEFQNFLKGLHIIDREIVDIAYLSTPDEEERQKRFVSLLKKAEQLQAHTEEIESRKGGGGTERTVKKGFYPFYPFYPARRIQKITFPGELSSGWYQGNGNSGAEQ